MMERTDICLQKFGQETRNNLEDLRVGDNIKMDV
jgi:hypothetical protein